MIDIILSSKEFSLKKYRHDLAAMVACKSSIKANHPLDAESARALLAELATCKNPYSCAHGRPTNCSFSGDDIQKNVPENPRNASFKSSFVERF